MSADPKPISKPQKADLSTDSKPQKANSKTTIHIIIGILIMFGGQYLPPIEPITEMGMKVLAIFIGVIYLWSTVESLWSSLLAVTALALCGYGNTNAVLKDAFGNSTVILVFFSMLFFGAVLEAGVAQYLSRWFMTRKISNGRPYVFTFIYIFGVYVVSALTNCFTALMISWPIAYTIIKDLGYTAKDKYAKFFVFGTFIGAILMSSALTADVTGIKPAIMNILNPLLGDRSVIATAIILMTFSFLITNVANNAVIGVIVLPIFGTFAAQAGLGAAAAPIATCTMLCLFLAFLTPAASPYAAMLYSNREWLNPSDILKFGTTFAITIILLYSTIGFAVAKAVFALI